MTHDCRCDHGLAAETCRGEIAKAPEPILADEIVADVAQHHAGALEVMKAMGINHCCGAQLTLREAAASAGVTLDALLTELNEWRKATPSPSPGKDGGRV